MPLDARFPTVTNPFTLARLQREADAHGKPTVEAPQRSTNPFAAQGGPQSFSVTSSSVFDALDAQPASSFAAPHHVFEPPVPASLRTSALSIRTSGQVAAPPQREGILISFDDDVAPSSPVTNPFDDDALSALSHEAASTASRPASVTSSSDGGTSIHSAEPRVGIAAATPEVEPQAAARMRNDELLEAARAARRAFVVGTGTRASLDAALAALPAPERAEEVRGAAIEMAHDAVASGKPKSSCDKKIVAAVEVRFSSAERLHANPEARERGAPEFYAQRARGMAPYLHDAKLRARVLQTLDVREARLDLPKPSAQQHAESVDAFERSILASFSSTLGLYEARAWAEDFTGAERVEARAFVDALEPARKKTDKLVDATLSFAEKLARQPGPSGADRARVYLERAHHWLDRVDDAKARTKLLLRLRSIEERIA